MPALSMRDSEGKNTTLPCGRQTHYQILYLEYLEEHGDVPNAVGMRRKGTKVGERVLDEALWRRHHINCLKGGRKFNQAENQKKSFAGNSRGGVGPWESGQRTDVGSTAGRKGPMGLCVLAAGWKHSPLPLSKGLPASGLHHQDLPPKPDLEWNPA